MKAGHVVVRLRSGAGGIAWRRIISHRLVGNLKPQIGQRPHNPVIAPGAVLLGHANNQFLNCLVDPGSAWASMLRAIELARDEPSVPSQNGIRQSGSRYVAECLAAQSTTNLAELRSLGVRELRPTLQLASQDLVLSGEIFIPQQQLLVHRPADVGQDACPLHELPHLPAGSQWPPLIAGNNVTDNARRAYAEWHRLPNFSCSANYLAIRDFAGDSC